jgi:phosphate-selective porin
MEVEKEVKTDFPKTKVGGYVQIQYDAYPNAPVNTSTDTFNISRARIEIKTELSKDFTGSVSFEATKLNTTTGLKTAYVDWKQLSYLNVRFGQFKIPFTRESVTLDSALDFVARSLAVDNLVTKLPDSYDTGIQFSGKRGIADYALAVTNGQAENTLDDNS